MTGALLLLLAVQQPPVFRVGVESVMVDAYASVGGQPLRGLKAEDFEIKDDGVVQQVELVAQEDAPVQAILVLDVSGSVAGPTLASLKAAAGAFLDGLRPQDRPTLLTFSHEIRATSATAGDPAAVRVALQAAQAGGATALHDALYAALQLADPRQGRPVILVFTDGADSLSWLPARRVAEAARESDAVVYAVDAGTATERFAPITAEIGDSRRRDSGRNLAGPLPGSNERMAPPTKVSAAANAPHSQLLRELADETGGEVWKTDKGVSLGEGFLKVLDQVKTRYVLRYEPSSPKEGLHRLEVRLRGRKGDVRSRRGYVYRTTGG